MTTLLDSRRANAIARRRMIALFLGLLIAAAVVLAFMIRRLTRYSVPGYVSPPALELPLFAAGVASVMWGQCELRFVHGLATMRCPDAHTAAAAGAHFFPEAARLNIDAMAEVVERSVATDRGLGARLRVDWALRFLPQSLAAEDLATTSALATLTSASTTDVVRSQFGFDLGSLADDKAADAAPLARAISGGWGKTPGLVARVLAFPALRGFGHSLRDLPVLIWVENAGRPFLNLTAPGLTGCVTCLSAGRLLVLVHPFASSDIRPTYIATPITALAESLVARDLTLDEAVRAIESTPTVGSATYYLFDSSSRRAVAVVRTPKTAASVPSPTVVETAPPGDALTADPLVDRARREAAQLGRAKRFGITARGAFATIDHAFAALLDPHAPPTLPVGHRGALADLFSAQTIVWDAVRDELTLLLADGTAVTLPVGSASGAMLLSDARVAKSRWDHSASVRRATAHLAEARDQLRDLTESGPRHVSDFAASAPHDVLRMFERALAAEPLLPEALATAALANAELGAAARARELLERWVAVGADAPRAEALLTARLRP